MSSYTRKPRVQGPPDPIIFDYEQSFVTENLNENVIFVKNSQWRFSSIWREFKAHQKQTFFKLENWGKI